MKLYSLIALLFLVNIAEAQFWRDSATVMVPSPSGKKVRISQFSVGDSTWKTAGGLAVNGNYLMYSNGTTWFVVATSVSGAVGNADSLGGLPASSYLLKTDTAIFVTMTTPQVISARKYFTQLLSADTLATGHIDPRSSSGGVSIHNANHVDVATFGVGSASSTNSAILGNLAITGYTTGSARATFPSLETDTIQSKTPSGNVVVNDTLYASALGVDTTLGTSNGRSVVFRGTTGNFFQLIRTATGTGTNMMRLVNPNTASLSTAFISWTFGPSQSDFGRIGMFSTGVTGARTSGIRMNTFNLATERTAILVDTSRRVGINMNSSTPTIATSTGQFAIYNNALEDNALELYNSRNTLIADVDSVGSAMFTGLQLGITTKTANYTATSSDYTILVDATSGAVTITLPAAASHTGRIYNIKKIDSSGNNMVIDPNGVETVDGNLTITTNVQYTNYQIISNGLAWYIL